MSDKILQAHTAIADSQSQVTTSFFSELMENYSPVRPVDAQHQLESIYLNNTPVVFSIGTENGFYILHPKDQSATGWVQYPLALNLGSVTAFDIYEESNDSLRIAMAVSRDGKNALFISDVHKFAEVDFSKFDPNTFFKTYTLPNPSATINQIRLDADGALVATEQAQKAAKYYTIDNSGKIAQYALPEHGTEVIALELGSVYQDRGVFLLYHIGDSLTMLFQSFPDPVYHKTSKYRFSPPGKISDFALLPAEDGTNPLITAGDGIYLFPNPDQTKEPIATSRLEIQYKKIRAAINEDQITLWLQGETQGQQSSLYYITNHFYDGISGDYKNKWTNPLPIQPNVDQFACIKGGEIENYLYVIDSENNLSHFYQDTHSTLWRENHIPLQDVGKAHQYDSYTLHIKFQNNDLTNALSGQKVKLSASAAIYVDINGAGYSLGPTSYAEIKLDINSELNIIRPTKVIGAPEIYINAPFLSDTLVIDLKHKLEERLKKYKTGSDLKAAHYPDGTKVIQKDPGAESLDAVAQGVQQFLKTSDHLRKKTNANNTSYSLTFSDDGGVAYNAGDSARNVFFEMAGVTGANVTILDVINDESLGSALGHAFGDVVHWIEGLFDKVAGFFIHIEKELVHFVIKIGKELYNFILTTAEQVFSAIEWLFKKIWIAFKDLIKWLGFLFEWKDILKTKNILKEFAINGLDATTAEIKTVQKKFDDWINDIIANKLKSPELVNQLNNFKDTSLSGWHDKKGNTQTDHADPRLNWGPSKFHHVSGYGPSGKPTTPEGILSQIAEAVKTAVQDFIIAFETIGDDINKLVHNQITIGEFAFKVLDTLAALILDMVKIIIDLLFEALEDIAEDIKKGLTYPIDIPLLSALYKMISGSDLSVLDLGCLLVAIPATIFNKIAHGKAPFDIINEKEFLKFPSKFVSNINLSGSNSDQELWSKNYGYTYSNPVAHSFVANFRMYRCLTFALVTYRAIKPAEGGGTSISVVLDNIFRYLSVFTAAFAGGNIPKAVIQNLVYFGWLALNGYMWLKQEKTGSAVGVSVGIPSKLQSKLGAALNVTGAVDAAVVMAFGIWAAVLTHDNWDQTADKPALRASSILVEIFQLPALIGFIANMVAKESEDDPYALVFAGVVAAIREIGMFGSMVSEFVMGDN